MEKEQTISKVKLWNPNAAAYWSILFTPIFGAWLHAKNWKELKEEDKAKKSMIWVYIGFVFLIVNLILPYGLRDAIWIIFLLAWYFFGARKQLKYLKDKNIDYQKKAWRKPLLIGLGGLIIYIICIIVLSLSGNNTKVECGYWGKGDFRFTLYSNGKLSSNPDYYAEVNKGKYRQPIDQGYLRTRDVNFGEGKYLLSKRERPMYFMDFIWTYPDGSSDAQVACYTYDDDTITVNENIFHRKNKKEELAAMRKKLDEN